MHDTTTVTISDMSTPADADAFRRDAEAFRRLNEAWISRLFGLVDEDRRYLDDPWGNIVRPGGVVLVARLGEGPDAQVIGCVGLAVLRPGDHGTGGDSDVVELVKMAVSDAHQGHGTGRRLIAAALERARSMGARRVVLESNSTLGSAVHLYESAGFRHLAPHEVEPSPYARADVAMRLDLR